MEPNGDLVRCPDCPSIYHVECWTYAGGKCVRLGCRGTTSFNAATWIQLFLQGGLGAIAGGLIGALLGVLLSVAGQVASLHKWSAWSMLSVGVLGGLVALLGAILYWAFKDDDWSFLRLFVPALAGAVVANLLFRLWPNGVIWLAGLIGLIWFGSLAVLPAIVLAEAFAHRWSPASWIPFSLALVGGCLGVYLFVLATQRAVVGSAVLWLGVPSLFAGAMAGMCYGLTRR